MSTPNNHSDEINLSAQPNNVSGNGQGKGLGNLKDMPVTLTAEVGSAVMKLNEAEQLKAGSTIMLDKQNGDLVDIKVNNLKIGTGKVTLEHGHYAVVVTELINEAE